MDAAQYPRVYLLIVEIVTCDVFLESQDKRSYEENIVKDVSNTSDLATEHHCETLFSLVKASTNRLAKTLQSNCSNRPVAMGWYGVANATPGEQYARANFKHDTPLTFHPYIFHRIDYSTLMKNDDSTPFLDVCENGQMLLKFP